MIKRTLYFGNPAYLKTTNEQMVVEMGDFAESKSIPIEDIGIVILDHQQITITQSLLAKLLANNTAVITCDHTHHPVGLHLSLGRAHFAKPEIQSSVSRVPSLKKAALATNHKRQNRKPGGSIKRRKGGK